MVTFRGLSAALATTVVVAVSLAAGLPRVDTEAEALFREQVFPVLQANCFKCHGPLAARIRSGLVLNGRDLLLRGGDRGPAVVPGDPETSLLVTAIRRTDPDLSMPPKQALPAEAVAAIERWVELGAPWPADLIETRRRSDDPDETPAVGDSETAPLAGDAPEPLDHDVLLFFENEVRPLLAQNCFECHGPELDKVKSGLRMSGRAALLRGGERGPAIVPGAPEDSRLIEAVRWTDADLSMPPDDKLSAEEIETLTRWVGLGAPWPEDGSGEAVAADDDGEAQGPDIAAGREWWSFRPVVRPEPPSVAAADRVANPIDAFVLARLEEQGLQPNPRADRATLVRRAFFDLLGLPPTAADVASFVNDELPDAWPRLIDSLLARPEYGERWGRHWLDVVRWAQTDGYERDAEKPFAWRYRDWVIDALNRDMRYDRFVLEQLAGDELPDATAGSITATGIYRIGVWDSEPDDIEQATFDELDDQLRVIAEGFMGVTLGCARCHDHKFDPFAQEDYYSTLAFLNNVRRYATPRFSRDSATLRMLDSSRETVQAWEQDRTRRIAACSEELKQLMTLGRQRAAQSRRDAQSADVREAQATAEDRRTPEQAELIAAAVHAGPPTDRDIMEALSHDEGRRVADLKLQIEELHKSFEGNATWALAVQEARGAAPDTHVLIRGRASAPAQSVEPRFVQVLSASDEAARPVLTEAAPNGRSSGRRLALAQWIVSPQHPTTARVMVNRIWQHHFGRGLVATPNDFGHTGTPPTHPELLDWLASEFVQRGWSLKAMHRLILTSNTWCMSSRAEDAACLERDPDNTLLWRQSLRRIEAEAVRDSVLAVAGTLSDERGGRGFFPRLSREALAGGSRPGQGWEMQPDTGREPRSVYCFVKRSLLPTLLEVLDYGNTSLPVGARSITTLASQALILLNSEFMGEQAAAFAARVQREAGDDPDAQITRAFELALARTPDEAELGIARDLFRREVADFATTGRDLVFRARLPSRVDTAFLQQLSGADLLFGPRDGWTYLRGSWGNSYNSTLELDRAAGPVALRAEPAFGDGSVSARVSLRAGCEVAALVLRGAVDGDTFSGVEAVLDPRAGQLRLVVQADGVPTVLAEAPVELLPETWHELRLQVAGPRLSVWLDGQGALDGEGAPLLEATAEGAVSQGLFGVRAWGETLRLADVHLVADGTPLSLQADDPGTPEQIALQSLCLMLFNLDEFLYVD